MKQVFALSLIIIVAVATYKIHQNRVDTAAAEAAALARQDAQDDLAKARAREEALRTRLNTTPPPRTLHAVNVARLLEPLYLEAFSELNTKSPADLVIPLQVTRERILDSKGRVDKDEQPIYEAASDFVAAMADIAEERTKMLESM